MLCLPPLHLLFDRQPANQNVATNSVDRKELGGGESTIANVEAAMVEAMEVTTMRREQFDAQRRGGATSENDLTFDIAVKVVAPDTKTGYLNLGVVNLPFTATLTQTRALIRSSRLVLPANLRFLRPDLDHNPEDFLDPAGSNSDSDDDGYADDFEDEGKPAAVGASNSEALVESKPTEGKRVKQELGEKQVLLFNTTFDTAAFSTKSVLLLEEVLAGWERRFEARTLRTLWLRGVGTDRSRPPTAAEMGFIPPPLASAEEVQELLKQAKAEMLKSGMNGAQLRAAKEKADKEAAAVATRGVMVSCDFRMQPLARRIVRMLNEEHEKAIQDTALDDGDSIVFQDQPERTVVPFAFMDLQKSKQSYEKQGTPISYYGSTQLNTAAGLGRAQAVVVLASSRYDAALDCRREINLADQRRVPIVPVLIEESAEEELAGPMMHDEHGAKEKTEHHKGKGVDHKADQGVGLSLTASVLAGLPSVHDCAPISGNIHILVHRATRILTSCCR
jgi:hypothetical protein